MNCLQKDTALLCETKFNVLQTLCPFAACGECRYGVNCTYLHGDVCDLCGRAMLHPTDVEEREKHKQVRNSYR